MNVNARKGGSNSNGNGPRDPMHDRTLGGLNDDRFTMA